jgi:two-component system, NarL family, sensor histidine kinase DesK
VTITVSAMPEVPPQVDREPDARGGWTFRDGRTGRAGVLFAAVWLVFLSDAVREGWTLARDGQHPVRGVIGLLAIAAFMAWYLAAFTWIRRRRQRMVSTVEPRAGALILGGLLALTVVMCVCVGEAGSAGAVYLAVVGVLCLPGRVALLFTAALAAAVEALGHTLPGWSGPASLAFAICTAAFAMWGVQQLMLRNVDLLRAREENARLAVADERNRFARDLHDILGHSLTVITVKAELANRLLDVDPDRARVELDDLERLSRDALSDVRRAVEGYRDLTLPGELARAREALRAADIAAELPNSTDEVPSELRELFAWTVREGVTNVIRHSRARVCTVRLTADRVEVRDDGDGPPADAPRGHGLDGLRERAASLGAVLVTRTLEPRGFALEVAAR